ncbi:MAG: Error-prone repair protein ImuA [Chitinophagaceae bacterium]|uniref:ImuA family protein n=1 Tax=unclassified Paraflavitalea TaxID=2798305 RepID=UPI003D32BDDC|nr:Error-prone repair protein ImuA [Chitinophagaceae bacterium]
MDKATVISQLRRDLMALGGIRASTVGSFQPTLPEFCRDHFPLGVFPSAAVHEICCSDPESIAAGYGFIAGMIKSVLKTNGVIVWIWDRWSLFPHGISAFGIDSQHILFVRPPTLKARQWILEEAVKCEGVAIVIAETHKVDFTLSRRLQLAVETSKVTTFLLNTSKQEPINNSCVSRWRIQPLPSSSDNALPGVGFPCWKVSLLKMRNGKPGEWEVRYKQGQLEEWTKPIELANEVLAQKQTPLVYKSKGDGEEKGVVAA